MITDTRNYLGDWWEGVKNATKDLDIPVLRETLLFAEGFIGGAANLVSDLTYLYFDVQQFTMELLFVGAEKLTGLNVAPDWMEKDVNGAWNNVVALKDAIGNTFTIENGKKDQYCWEIVFYRCFKVDYETDAGWTCWKSETGTRNFNMKDIPFENLMSHTVHDIRLIEEKNDMIQATITLSSMLIKIVCQEIQVSKVLVREQNFFWEP